MKKSKGVSLIELLVVITIFSVLAILATRGVLLTLRGSRKSESISKVRENLGFSFAVMERHLRNADSVDCARPTRVDFQDKKGNSVYFSCEDLATDGYISSSSARLTSEEVRITACDFTCETGGAGVPPSVSVSISGEEASITGVEGAQVTVTTKILLRTY